MNNNNIRNFMGKENAGTASPTTTPVLGSIGRRKSVAYTNDRIKEMILKAPFIETVEEIGGSDEGDGDRESFASALSLPLIDSQPKHEEDFGLAMRQEAPRGTSHQAQ
jgi:hypothetical protein